MKKTTTKQTTANILATPAYTTRNLESLIPTITLFLKKLPFFSSNTNSDVYTTNSSKNRKKIKTLIPVAIIVVIIGAVILFSGRLLRSSANGASKDQRAIVAGPKANIVLNKEFSFPLVDSKGKEVTRLKYIVENAELRDEIIVKGNRATSVKGRTFLILNIKIVNTYDKGLDISARDYVRLTVNDNQNELLAADIHNDPVSVQPISTKLTRLGFPINDSDRNLVLKVGEIKGNKEDITLGF